MSGQSPEDFGEATFVRMEREVFFRSVVGFMREDGRGLDAALARMRELVEDRIYEYDSEEDTMLRNDMLRVFEETEQWMRATIKQARELVALADQTEGQL